MNKLSLTVAFLATLVAGVSCAHATSITYTFTTSSSDSYAGTSFTYVDPAGFLAFDTGKLTPTTASHLFIFGTDDGLLTGFDFVSSQEYVLYYAGGNTDTTFGSATYQISALTSGENLPSTETIAITNTVAVTPEPSSLVLLGTGLLGAIGAARRRLRKA